MLCQLPKKTLTVIRPVMSAEFILINLHSNQPVSQRQADIDRPSGLSCQLLVNILDGYTKFPKVIISVWPFISIPQT